MREAQAARTHAIACGATAAGDAGAHGGRVCVCACVCMLRLCLHVRAWACGHVRAHWHCHMQPCAEACPAASS